MSDASGLPNAERLLSNLAGPELHRSETRCEMQQRRVVVTRRGGPEVLEVIEEPGPRPAPGEVRVKIVAAGVSAYDLMMRSRWLPGNPRPPFTLGVDIVGVVDELGEGVSAVEVGQMVAALTGFRGGGYAEYVCLPQGTLVAVPSGVDAAEAVCVVANYLTAHVAMHATAGVRNGERVLIHGAAGGVGSALLELGREAGLTMFATASRPNQDLVASLGATPIDYHTEDFVARIRDLTSDGVDAVFDPIGGGRQLWRSSRVLRRGGRLVWFGVAASKRRGVRVIPASLSMLLMLKLMPDGKRALTTADLQKDNDRYRKTLAELLDWLAAGRLEPIIAERFPLVEAAHAHELLERGGYAGKVVLLTGADV